MQAGLSWALILKKRQNFRHAFDNFIPEKIAAYDKQKIESLLHDEGIIRNRLKIDSVVKNARAFLKLLEEHESFDSYIWSFVKGRPVQNSWKTIQEIPAKTRESEAMSRSLHHKGFRFVGPTICYAFMQAVGLVNDHTVDCFRYKELGG
jgi:DNA-3-methyladenine glycosylase I